MVRRALLLMVLTFAVPASAQAATVTLSGGVLKFTAAPGLVKAGSPRLGTILHWLAVLFTAGIAAWGMLPGSQ